MSDKSKSPLAGLAYVGGGAFLGDVPARDLSPAEAEQYGRKFLLSTGLYVEWLELKAGDKSVEG